MKRLGQTDALEDPRFATYVNRKNNETAIVEIVTEALKSWTADDLVAALMEDGIPCSPVKNLDEVFADPHIIDRGVVVEVEHPKLGTVKSIRNPIVFEHDTPSIERPAPLLGQHSQEVLREFDYSDDEIAAFAANGVTVLL